MRGSLSQLDPTSAAVIAGLEHLGYRGPLLERHYSFPDWFAGQQERTLLAAAFGQTPVSYESACIAVAQADGLRELALVNAFRAFGAPILLEIDGDEVREWAVSRLADNHTLIGRYSVANIPDVMASRAQDWTPASLLRAKNIGTFRWVEQLGLFAGLIPELETQIQDKLDPLLRETLSRTRSAYIESAGKTPNAKDLFTLVFWTLTAKVFHDRHVPTFANLQPNPDTLLDAVAGQYKTSTPRLLNRAARETAARNVWRDLDFRNLSVDVLAHIWARTLVDRHTRKRLGIHRTPRTIVRYIVDRVPFPQTDDEKRIVFEPCSGSAAFLIGALNVLRPKLPLASPRERHEYFIKHLAGIEFDAFGVEVSKLALTLADFPNPNGWEIANADVFVPGSMTEFLRRSSVVLCNPPFERLTIKDRQQYHATAARKPAELLNRVLDDLHPTGVIGFVLPSIAVDGREYAQTRKRLTERFESVELTILPDKAFDESEVEVSILIATDPIPHTSTRVAFRRVNAADWDGFQREHIVSSDYAVTFAPDEAAEGLAVPELAEVWTYLADHQTLGEVAEIHRGIEWKTRRTAGLHFRDKPAQGYARGLAPGTKFQAFQVPIMQHLNVQPDEQRVNAWKLPWSKPKAIVNKARRSRGHWRMAAFADRDGVICYQTFAGVWSRSDKYDAVILAAILNSPVANAFVATREGTRDITLEVLRLIPVPVFSPVQAETVRALIERYERAINHLSLVAPEDLETLLKRIDAAVLDGYRLPPRLERMVLDYFTAGGRSVGHDFGSYFPGTFDIYVPLSKYLDPAFSRATVGELLKGIDTH